MTKEERDAEMLGVPVYRWDWKAHGRDFNDEFVHASDLDVHPLTEHEPGRWHAEPVAVAMVEVVEAARALIARPYFRDLHSCDETRAALRNLDAALGGGRNG